jgi:hypothetical protein
MSDERIILPPGGNVPWEYQLFYPDFPDEPWGEEVFDSLEAAEHDQKYILDTDGARTVIVRRPVAPWEVYVPEDSP